jgi:hypothetical protein
MSAASDLPDWIIHNLLKDVEASSKPREEVVLKCLCHNKEPIYGASASTTRRCIQKKWDLIKRRSISSYIELLDYHTVPYGAATLRLVTQSFDADEAPIDYRDGEEEDEQEAPASVEQETSASVEQETSSSVAAIASAFEGISLGDNNTANDLPFSPIRTSASASTMADSTVVKDRSIHMAGNVPDGSNATPHLGSKTNPNIIHVNKEFPEQNGEFDVQYVQGIALQGSKRNGWHIRIRISMEDSTLWSAVVYFGLDPALAYRTILIKGPSCAGWLTEHAAFGKKIQCAATTEYHQETVMQISLDDDGKVKYWLLVFPEGTYFDNLTLSTDPLRININAHGIVQTHDGSKKNEFRTVTANWRIVDKFGGRLLEPETEKELNYNDVF